MGLALRDVNESLAGSLGIAEGTTEYVNMTSSVSDTVENFIGDGSAISTKLTEELYKLTSEVKDTIKTLMKKPTDIEAISGLSPVMKESLGEEEKRTLAGAKKIIADMMTADEEMESFTASVMRTPEKATINQNNSSTVQYLKHGKTISRTRDASSTSTTTTVANYSAYSGATEAGQTWI